MKDLLIFIAFLGLYFLPTVIAYRRNHHNKGSILVIDLFFGRTMLGWVIALAMSLSGVKK